MTDNVAMELSPRKYQEILIRQCVQENSVIFLPTGAGKTFIAVCALKELAKDDFSKCYSEGGKIAVFLVNTVALVHQHSNYLSRITPYKIGSYTGDMNVDYWLKEKWLEEFNNNNVLVMTTQIFKNLLTAGYGDLSKVNVLIFDECHRGVENHPMREIMRGFNGIQNLPRVIGLTATLLNGNVKPSQVMNEIYKLETTFHGKIAAADNLANVLGFSTNPMEKLVCFKNESGPILNEICNELRNLECAIRSFKPSQPITADKTLNLLKKEYPFKKFYKLLMDATIQFEMFGIWGARIGCILYIIHMELEKCACSDAKSLMVINTIITKFTDIQARLEILCNAYPKEQRPFKLATSKVHKLVQILMDFKDSSNEEFCGIVFVERKNTAIFLYHILNEMKSVYDNLKFIRPDFIIGYNTNPLNCPTESLYYKRLNRKAITKFISKEVNLLIATNVIEEGIDIPICNLVVKFDRVKDYRAYVQSKGRARHAKSLYYIMVESPDMPNFQTVYSGFQQVENLLNDRLVGSNGQRDDPSEKAIANMYQEIEEFTVDGPGSAHITEVSAMQTLMMYCSSVKCDQYTTYEPIFYANAGYKAGDPIQACVELPIFCPIKDVIYGDWKSTKRDAKRSAAFIACKELYKIGELTDNLIPKSKQVSIKDLAYLFTHWPKQVEKSDGTMKRKRVYEKKIPECIRSHISPTSAVYLHVINMMPSFRDSENKMETMYENNLCFGLISAEPLPILCRFPVFVTLGQIIISLDVNKNVLHLMENQLEQIKNFHHVVFNDILGITRNYLTLGTSNSQLYVVPILKKENKIDFDTIISHEKINDFYREFTTEEKLDLEVNDKEYLGKIVTPYYRCERKHHLVLEVCYNLTASSPFPNADHGTFADYYDSKYQRLIVNHNLPMLRVKPLSSALNCLKPKGAATKRKRDESYDNMDQHFIPELCIKQDFPACLWISARLLPTIFHRVEHLLRAEELRRTIVREAQLGKADVTGWEPLQLDMNLIRFAIDATAAPTVEDAPMDHTTCADLNTEVSEDLIDFSSLNKRFKTVMDDTSYPWDPEIEPIDFTRNLNISMFDLEIYAKFISMDHSAHDSSGTTSLIETPEKTKCLAINYTGPNYTYKPISFLNSKRNQKGPELSSIFEALCTAKANEVVNLERMETLGDSFLKLVASLFIFIEFPNYTEGEATELKSRMISNRNLYYLAVVKNIGGLLNMYELNVKNEWLPPGYNVPGLMCGLIDANSMHIESLFSIHIPRDEQISGVLSQSTFKLIEKEVTEVEENSHSMEVEESSHSNSYASMCHYLGRQTVGDKTLADVVEALIGVYTKTMTIQDGLKFIEWLGIIPENKAQRLFNVPVSNPIISARNSADDITYLLCNFEAESIESIIGYRFKNRAFLLQAITHSSFISNRVTLSYQRLEFIGDAVLDALITFFIFENNPSLDPGELTDLRSALVNNETFAAYVVKLGLHKYLKHYNQKLCANIQKFEQYQEQRNHEITSDVLILLNEEHLHIAENVDVPKVLGDLFEALAGAIFLDSNKDLNVVWQVFHKIMWREIELFSSDVPKNPVRMLYESLQPIPPTFYEPVEVANGMIMMKMDFPLNGRIQRVHGFGENKSSAKKASAKIALRMLSVKKEKI